MNITVNKKPMSNTGGNFYAQEIEKINLENKANSILSKWSHLLYEGESDPIDLKYFVKKPNNTQIIINQNKNNNPPTIIKITTLPEERVLTTGIAATNGIAATSTNELVIDQNSDTNSQSSGSANKSVSFAPSNNIVDNHQQEQSITSPNQSRTDLLLDKLNLNDNLQKRQITIINKPQNPIPIPPSITSTSSKAIAFKEPSINNDSIKNQTPQLSSATISSKSIRSNSSMNEKPPKTQKMQILYPTVSSKSSRTPIPIIRKTSLNDTLSRTPKLNRAVTDLTPRSTVKSTKSAIGDTSVSNTQTLRKTTIDEISISKKEKKSDKQSNGTSKESSSSNTTRNHSSHHNRPRSKGPITNVYKFTDDESFAKHVIKNPKPVIVEFYSAWCGPCRILEPLLEKYVKSYDGKADIVKIDISYSYIPSEYQINTVPTVIAFKNGKETNRFVSFNANDDERLRLFIKKAIEG